MVDGGFECCEVCEGCLRDEYAGTFELVGEFAVYASFVGDRYFYG